MNRQNSSGEYEGVQTVGMLMMHILNVSYFCYLIKLSCSLYIYFIRETIELIFYYNKTKEFELIIRGTVVDMHFLIRCQA
jgi:hypothetical protein